MKVYEFDCFTEDFLRFEERTKNKLKSYEKEISLVEFYKIYSITRKKPIKNSVIELFYDEPEKFFSQYKTLLKGTSYYDISGNSIIMHYFNVLFEEYKHNQRDKLKQNFINNKESIYESNFNTFFQENKNYLFVQDICLDTPLHKIARFNDKTFFIIICLKLNELGIMTIDLLKTYNMNVEFIYDYIFEEIKNK